MYKRQGAEVVTRCYGYVASAATVIAQAASPGCREISSNAFYLIHCSELSLIHIYTCDRSVSHAEQEWVESISS